jgi:hypothetical protein
MEKTMQKCRRYSGAYDFGFRISDFGLKDLQKVLRTRGSVFDFGFAIADCGLKDLQKVLRTRGSACDFGFRISDFGFQSLDKERRSKWPVIECFAKHLSNRAEKLNSKNVSKPLTRMADCIPASASQSLPDCSMLTGEVEMCCSEVKGSFNDPTSAGQTDETGRSVYHFQVSVPDRSSISTLSFEPASTSFCRVNLSL